MEEEERRPPLVQKTIDDHLNRLTVRQLEQYAKSHGIAFPKGMVKAHKIDYLIQNIQEDKLEYPKPTRYKEFT